MDTMKFEPANSEAVLTSLVFVDKPACSDVCPVCCGSLMEIRGKLHCTRCHTICETCCEGGRG